MKYIFNSLDAEDLRQIKNWPVEMKINYKGLNILFTHYAHSSDGIVRDDYEEFSESHLDKLFGDKKSEIVFFGHTHRRKLIMNEGGKSYICLGSSGCVKGDKTFYTYFDINNGMGEDLNYDFYRITVKFNRKKFEEKLARTPLPDKDKYAKPCFGIETTTGI